MIEKILVYWCTVDGTPIDYEIEKKLNRNAVGDGENGFFFIEGAVIYDGVQSIILLSNACVRF